METLKSHYGFAYWGESEGWGIVIGTHRDDDALGRSNFAVIRDDLTTRFPDDVRVESFSNWLVGWSESVLVRPDSEAWKAAEEWQAKLEDYPVANEDAWGEEESEEAFESATEFVRCELPYTLREHAEDVAGFILAEFEDDSQWCAPGGWWPRIDRNGEDRDRVAAGIRAWRNWKRKARWHKANRWNL